MLLKSMNIDFFTDSRVIIAPAQTETTYICAQKTAAHFPGVFQGRAYQTAVMHVGPCYCHSKRNTPTIHMEMDLASASFSVCRIAPEALRR